MDAFIFDMDGVIVDSELHWKSLEGFFLKSLVPTWGSADQGRIIGLSVHDLYRLLRDEYGLTDSKAQFLELYHAMAADIYGRKASLLGGFTELLAALNRGGIPIALASSSPRSWIDIVLGRFDLRGAFRAVVSAAELQGRGKPAPDIYLLTARKLGVPPHGCIVVEDSENGVLSAKSAGMYCIGLRNGFNDDQDLSKADLLIGSLTELHLPRLKRLV
jgi:HAD superfamily hydrolase (TIGR01509 family)